jgi:hypothetical protein
MIKSKRSRKYSTHGKKRMYKIFWWESKQKREHYEYNVNMILEKMDGVAWTGFIWLI